jgi:hypothetical protein
MFFQKFFIVLITICVFSCNNYQSNENQHNEIEAPGINYFEEYIYSEPNIFVGPTRAYKTPSEAAAVAVNGDVIEIDPGTYYDIAIW